MNKLQQIQLKQAWYALDEAATKCSARHGRRFCYVCSRIEEAMKFIPEKPSPEECRELFTLRSGSSH